MDKWVEYDPVKGIREDNAIDPDSGDLVVTKWQDVEPLLERNAAIRNSGDADAGIRKGLWHYASIPEVIQYEMLKKGINVQSKWDRAKVLDEINANYPHLKLTNKHHSIKRRRTTTKVSLTKPGPLLIAK
jgi:hypothetical protein